MVRTEDEIKKHDLIDLSWFLLWGLVALYGYLSASPANEYRPNKVKHISLETPKSLIVDTKIVTFSGLSPGVKVDMIDDTTWIGSSKVGEGGRWMIKMPIEMVDGRLITFRAEDENGNPVGEKLGPFGYQRAPILRSEPGESPSKPPKVEKPQSGSSLIKGKNTVVGKAEPGAKIKVYANKVLLATTIADNRGTWKTTVSFDPGAKRLSAVAADSSKHTIEFEVH